MSLTKSGFYRKDLKGSYISRVVENTDLYKPVLNKIMTTCEQCIKLRHFTDHNGSKGGPHENEFWPFSNTKMNVTNRVEKVDEKWGRLSNFQVSFRSYGL